MGDKMSDAENEALMQKGELYYAFTPSLVAQRNRCKIAFDKFNAAGGAPRRELVKLWRDVVNDKSPLPPPGATEEEDAILLQDEANIDGPIKLDYGTNIKLGKGVYINANACFIDTCLISIGARTMVAPNCSFYSGTHPLDPFLRNGIKGPEYGKPINIGEDCWIGGGSIILPGITIGRGSTVGAGSVVTKDVPAFHCVAGNPARIIRKIEPQAKDPTLSIDEGNEAIVAAAAQV